MSRVFKITDQNHVESYILKLRILQLSKHRENFIALEVLDKRLDFKHHLTDIYEKKYSFGIKKNYERRRFLKENFFTTL